MTTYFHFADSVHSPEMRHEIGEAVGDPVFFADHDGRRIVGCGPFEVDIFTKREDVVDEVIAFESLGLEALIADHSIDEHLIDCEIALRALQQLGSPEVVVPSRFPILLADYLRDKGIAVVVDHAAWTERRRRKAPWEIEGIERAQRAAETAMMTAARMLREAEPTGQGTLRFEGEILTAELIREAMVAELLTQGAESEDIIVHSGDSCLAGHEVGSGPILPDTTCIIDCFPRDRRSGAYADLTRTFVPGTPSEEARSLHAHCRKALDVAFDSLKAGTKDGYAHVEEYFHAQGYPTQLHHEGEGLVREGFMHSLGHGVGLEVHEPPWMGRRADPLVVGDVVAVEPGLYFKGIGGVRLEDTVLITEDGVEHFTDPLSYDLEP